MQQQNKQTNKQTNKQNEQTDRRSRQKCKNNDREERETENNISAWATRKNNNTDREKERQTQKESVHVDPSSSDRSLPYSFQWQQASLVLFGDPSPSSWSSMSERPLLLLSPSILSILFLLIILTLKACNRLCFVLIFFFRIIAIPLMIIIFHLGVRLSPSSSTSLPWMRASVLLCSAVPPPPPVHDCHHVKFVTSEGADEGRGAREGWERWEWERWEMERLTKKQKQMKKKRKR